jgi:glycosyltransferase involved in cell wall biosynthesis
MNHTDTQPMVSFIIPTLNAERTLRKCLASIENQEYPKEKIEIVFADGGSTDSTLEIIETFRQRSPIRYTVVKNELKTTEAGMVVGIDASSGQILGSVDSDNVLDGKDWLQKMLLPFQDEETFASEALYWAYHKDDALIDRYCALTGVNDPICLFLGNYDRWSYLTSRWTDMKLKQEIDRGDYLEVVLDEGNVPTMGANGFLIRKEALQAIHGKDNPYYFDIDAVAELVKKGFAKIGRPKVGVRHYYSNTIGTFIKKQNRRIRDYWYFKYHKKMRTYSYKLQSLQFIKFILYTLLVFPLYLQAIHGFRKKRDSAWFFHPLACWITLIVYSLGTVQSLINPKIADRTKWRQ